MDEVNDEMGEGLDKAKSLKDKAAEAKEALTGKAGDAADGGEGLADKAKGLLGGAADKAKGAAPDAPDMPGGVSGKGAAVAGGAAAAAGGLAGKAKGMVSGAADKAKGAAPDMPGKPDMPDAPDMPDVDMPDAPDVSGKGAAVAGGAAAAAGGLAGKAKGMVSGAADKAKGAASSATDAAGGMADKAKGAASGAGDKAKGAASGAGDKAKGAAAAGAGATLASSSSSSSSSKVIQDGGSGGSGGSGGGSGDDDDDDKLFGWLPIAGDWQIIGAGLLAFIALFFGSQILGFFGGDVEEAVEAVALGEVTDERCERAIENLEDSDIDPDVLANVTCGVDVNGEIDLGGEIPDEGDRALIVAAAAGVGAASLDIDGSSLFTVEEEVEEVAAEVTTTTAAPTTTTAAPTTTTEAPTTTTEAPTTTTEAPAPEPFTMWDALTESGEAPQFAAVGGALGLQAFLEEIEDEDGNTVMRTLFAPSDAALEALGTDAIGAIAADQDAANALVGYHVLDETLLASDLAALDGQSLDTSVGLPLAVSTDDGGVILNNTSLVTVTDLVADNGVVHIVDVVLQPPTINQILDLENIEFEVSSATITAAGQETLQQAVAFFTENATVNAVIEGHTDTDGTDEVNQELSQARAQSVVNFLVTNGLEESRFTPVGFGETQPILVDGVEDKEASRRIEFVAR